MQTYFAPVNHAYDNPVIGMQITVGSTRVYGEWTRMRAAGAEARLRAGYGELAAAAIVVLKLAALQLASAAYINRPTSDAESVDAAA